MTHRVKVSAGGRCKPGSTVASERLKRAHRAAAYDTWFREQVQASIDDPRSSVDDDKVRRHFVAQRTAAGPA